MPRAIRLTGLFSLLLALLAGAAILAFVETQEAQGAQNLGAAELGFLANLNAYRAQNGLDPIVLNDSLNDAARWLAQDSADHDYSGHTDSLKRDMSTRLKALIQPFPFAKWSENVAAGFRDADSVIKAWKGSPPHNANMLGPYNVIGIALVCKSGTTYGCYWATDYGFLPGDVPPTHGGTAQPTT
ncbi:MAG: CAP domain-containing protein [Chloroflexota bacterium]